MNHGAYKKPVVIRQVFKLFSADWVDYDGQIKKAKLQKITIEDPPEKNGIVSVGYRSKKGNTNGGITKP